MDLLIPSAKMSWFIPKFSLSAADNYFPIQTGNGKWIVFNHWVNDVLFSPQVLRKLQQLSVFSQSSLQDTAYDCHMRQQALLFIGARTEKMLLDLKRKQMSLHVMSKSLHNEVLEDRKEEKTLWMNELCSYLYSCESQMYGNHILGVWVTDAAVFSHFSTRRSHSCTNDWSCVD